MSRSPLASTGALLLLAFSSYAADVAIHDIQGNGARSPLVGQAVTTLGVVTGVASNGYYVQAPDAEADADPRTSEGLFVFTSSRPPGSVVVGNLVSVTGTVAEFTPGSDPTSLPLTELTSVTTSFVSSGNPLPAAVPLTAAELSPLGPVDQLERLEGMRVSVAELRVVAPTGGTVNEPSATSSTNGVFWGVLPGAPRPRRETGVDVLVPLPAGSPCCVPRFDTNPELLRVDGDGIGASALEVSTGATVVGLVGPLTYTSRAYTLNAESGAVASGSRTYRPVPVPGPDEVTVASFNLERFFDTVDDSGVSDVALTTGGFATRLAKASLAVRDVLRLPDVVAVMEVENLSTLTAIAARVNADVTGAQPGYVAFLSEGNDPGGIDVGFLVKTSRVNVVSVTQVGKSATFTSPSGQSELLNDRPPLVLQALLGPPGNRLPLTVIANHLRSLTGIDDAGDGPRVRLKRRAQAEFLADLIQTHQAAGELVAAVGDFNAFEVSDGYVDVIGTVRGAPAPADQVVLASRDLVDPDLTDLVDSLPLAERYSYAFAGNAQVLDHVLVSQGLLPHVCGLWFGRLDADLPETLRGDPTRPERLSDHDPVVLYLRPSVTAFTATRVVPVVLDVAGRGGVRFTSELTLANRGSTRAEVDLAYTAAAALSASGSGTIPLSLGPGEQLVLRDAIAFLRDRGLPVPSSGGQGGSLRASFRNLSAPGDAYASARTTAPSGNGRAGLAYPGLAPDASVSRLQLFGLRETDADRTNLALVNAGALPDAGDVTLGVTLSAGGQSRTLPEVTLGPGEWRHLNQVLLGTGLTSALARVERVAGSAPFLAYAVFNDNVTSDGSFVPAVAAPSTSAVVPVLVETPVFSSELVLANPGGEALTATLTYTESLASGAEPATVTETLAPGEQKILPAALEYLRGKGAAIGARGGAYAGSLRVAFDRPGFAGARTGAPAEGGGQYGLFYPAVAAAFAATSEAWVHGLVQDASARSNLALVNAGGSGSLTLSVEVYDGPSGRRLGATEPLTLPPGGWRQLNGILSSFGSSGGYARVVRLEGTGSFLAYGVVNDGATSASGTNDGSYVAMELPAP